MQKITEKPDFPNDRAVKVWTEASVRRFLEIVKPYLLRNFLDHAIGVF